MKKMRIARALFSKLIDLNIEFQVDVHCFLLTDLLLICKPIAKKGMSNLKVIMCFAPFSVSIFTLDS